MMRLWDVNTAAKLLSVCTWNSEFRPIKVSEYLIKYENQLIELQKSQITNEQLECLTFTPRFHSFYWNRRGFKRLIHSISKTVTTDSVLAVLLEGNLQEKMKIGSRCWLSAFSDEDGLKKTK